MIALAEPVEPGFRGTSCLSSLEAQVFDQAVVYGSRLGCRFRVRISGFRQIMEFGVPNLPAIIAESASDIRLRL